MRIINVMIYFIMFILLGIYIQVKKRQKVRWHKFFIYQKEYIKIWILFLIINTISFCMSYQLSSEELFIERDGFNGEEKEVILYLEDKKNTEAFSLKVQPQKLSDKECKKRMKEAFIDLDKNLKGENTSLKKVTENLNFYLDHEKYPFEVEFLPDDYKLVDEEGIVNNQIEELEYLGYQNIDQGIQSKVNVILYYGEILESKEYKFTVFPKKDYFQNIKDEFRKKEEKEIYHSGFYIPTKKDGIQIKRKEERITSNQVLLFGFLFAGLLIFYESEKRKREREEKRKRLLKSYPWFVNELLLLLGAGMQVKNIFFLIVSNYKKEERIEKVKDEREVLVEEIKVANHQLELGFSEEEVYHQLGRRIGLPCYIKVMTMLEQNVKKGNKELTKNLEEEELAALEERKNMAKRYGEEAGTKLLGPMILLLLAMMLIIMLPAFLSL